MTAEGREPSRVMAVKLDKHCSGYVEQLT